MIIDYLLFGAMGWLIAGPRGVAWSIIITTIMYAIIKGSA